MLSISDFLVCTFSSQVVQFPNLLQFIWSGNFFYIWSWEAISCTNCPLTSSAQVCRIAYELMQQHHVDASDRFKSLDDIWWVLRSNHWSYSFLCKWRDQCQPMLCRYYGGQDEHQQEAVLRHEVEGRSGEISLEVGDVLGVAGNHWNGFNKGRNHRTNRWEPISNLTKNLLSTSTLHFRVGLYPEYKTKEKLRVVNFPKYPSVQTPWKSNHKKWTWKSDHNETGEIFLLRRRLGDVMKFSYCNSVTRRKQNYLGKLCLKVYAVKTL